MIPWRRQWSIRPPPLAWVAGGGVYVIPAPDVEIEIGQLHHLRLHLGAADNATDQAGPYARVHAWVGPSGPPVISQGALVGPAAAEAMIAQSDPSVGAAVPGSTTPVIDWDLGQDARQWCGGPLHLAIEARYPAGLAASARPHWLLIAAGLAPRACACRGGA